MKRNSRATVHTQGAHSVHAHLTHVHTLIGDLDTAALEVLLVEHTHLPTERGGENIRLRKKDIKQSINNND